ncbi:hypothetical protein K474DRAFT_1673588 [Panus rudis PR-1116 ss-1]|nr:hypothetical protein K474DRAFT_1673588 [Panus rudis PR-1116 ss-1]
MNNHGDSTDLSVFELQYLVENQGLELYSAVSQKHPFPDPKRCPHDGTFYNNKGLHTGIRDTLRLDPSLSCPLNVSISPACLEGSSETIPSSSSDTVASSASSPRSVGSAAPLLSVHSLPTTTQDVLNCSAGRYSSPPSDGASVQQGEEPNYHKLCNHPALAMPKMKSTAPYASPEASVSSDGNGWDSLGLLPSVPATSPGRSRPRTRFTEQATLSPLYRPYKCPNPECIKSYTQTKGLMRHLQRRWCNSWCSEELRQFEDTWLNNKLYACCIEDCASRYGGSRSLRRTLMATCQYESHHLRDDRDQ